MHTKTQPLQIAVYYLVVIISIMSRDTWKNKIYRAFVTNLNYYYLHSYHFHYPYSSRVIDYDIFKYFISSIILYLLFHFLL